MRHRRWWILIISILVLVMLGIYLPMFVSYNSYCVYCRARRTIESIYLVPFTIRIQQNALSKYWIANVEPNHKHVWTPTLCSTYYIVWVHFNGIEHSLRCKVSGNPIYSLPPEIELALLKSLPDNNARRDFVDGFWRYGPNPNKNTEEKLMMVVYAIKDSYAENPNRDDWLEVIRKAGFKMPGTTLPTPNPP